MSIVARGLGLPASSLVAGGLGISEAITALYGDGYLEHFGGESYGAGSVSGGLVVAVTPDSHPGGIPSTKFLADAMARQGLALHGDGVAENDAAEVIGAGSTFKSTRFGNGSAEQAAGEAVGSGRVRRAVLVAVSAMAESDAGSAGQSTAEFVDVELQKFALAAAVGVNEWQRAA